MIYNANNKLGGIFYGGNEIGKVYYGNDLVYSSYKEIDLGPVTINATGDYAWNLWTNARAYKIRMNGRWYLKITGRWYSKGDNVSGNVKAFSTNINVGAQPSEVSFECNCFYNTTNDNTGGASRYNVYSGKVATDGTVWLTLGHENCYRTFNQYDYDHYLIPIS